MENERKQKAAKKTASRRHSFGSYGSRDGCPGAVRGTKADAFGGLAAVCFHFLSGKRETRPPLTKDFTGTFRAHYGGSPLPPLSNGTVSSARGRAEQDKKGVVLQPIFCCCSSFRFPFSLNSGNPHSEAVNLAGTRPKGDSADD